MGSPVAKLREVRRDLAGLRRAFEQAPIAPARELLLDPEVEEQFGKALAGVIAQLVAQGDLPQEVIEEPGKLATALQSLLRDIASHKGVMASALRRLKRRGVGQEIRLVRRTLSRVS